SDRALYVLKPVPPQRWHFTFLSPNLIRPLPSQLVHFAFFFPAFACMDFSRFPCQCLRLGAGESHRLSAGVEYLADFPHHHTLDQRLGDEFGAAVQPALMYDRVARVATALGRDRRRLPRQACKRWRKSRAASAAAAQPAVDAQSSAAAHEQEKEAAEHGHILVEV